MLDTPLSSSVVVHDLRPRVRADREDLSVHHSACVDGDDLACEDFVKAKAFVDEPPVDDQLRDFGLVREGFGQAGFLSPRPLSRRSLSSLSSRLLSVYTQR